MTSDIKLKFIKTFSFPHSLNYLLKCSNLCLRLGHVEYDSSIAKITKRNMT